MVIEAYSGSTSVVPASIPFAPLWALFLWWFPFDDLATNYDHLLYVRKHLRERHGLHVEQTVVHRGTGFQDFACSLFPFLQQPRRLQR